MAGISINTLQTMKEAKDKIAMLTAYDACFAYQQEAAGIDVILIGDSLGMVLQGEKSTLPVSIEDMVYHTRSVSRGISDNGPLLLADMPFMGCATLQQALDYAKQLMQAGAHMIKLEGGAWLADIVTTLLRNGIPVCAHLGLTPQSVNALGGYKVQAKDKTQADLLISEAEALEAAGAAMVLVECIPSSLGKTLSERLSVPVIGIGAGKECDGQVLVMHDMLGITPGKTAKFVRNFMLDSESIQQAFANYAQAVKSGSFPAETHTFS